MTGAVFTPRTPLASAEGTPRPMHPERSSLLVVDDDPASRALLRRYLTGHGFDITDAANGAEALALLKTQDFDLVLLDVEMPDVGGLDVLRELRQVYSAAELP